MQKIVFVLGGSRSGKSTFALREASSFPGKKAFVATAECLDDEMRVRIENHKKERGKGWVTHEEPVFIARLIERVRGIYDVVLIDCLTLWLANIMQAKLNVHDEIKVLTSSILENRPPLLYIVSNEVGMGIVPESNLARTYRDELGFLNQQIASIADEVYFMAAGIPLRVKGMN